MVGSLGKIAKDIALMGQYEVGEVAEPSEPGRGGSSAMPHKRNPVASMVALAAAQRAPQRVAALLAAMPQEHERALGAWQAELAEWPQLLMSAHGSVRALAGALPGLQVDAARMRANIDRLRAELPREAADEWFDPALAEPAGAIALAQVMALASSTRHTGHRTMTSPETPADDYEAGLVNRRRILGDAWVDKSLANRNGFNSEFQELITRHAWNDIWGRPALGDKTRRYMVLSMMLGIHAYEEFAMHVRAALDGPPESRLTPDDIKEVIMMAAIYCGVPVANHAFGIATGILREKGLLEELKGNP